MVILCGISLLSFLLAYYTKNVKKIYAKSTDIMALNLQSAPVLAIQHTNNYHPLACSKGAWH